MTNIREYGKYPVKMTLNAIQSLEKTQKPYSSIQGYTSNQDSHERFAATGQSANRQHGTEIQMKRFQRGVFEGDQGKRGHGDSKR